jgi:transketolase
MSAAEPYHAPVPREPSWDLATSAALSRSAIAGEVLAEMADEDDRIVVLTADLMYSNRTSGFAARHPERFLNVGIAEQNMLTVAAGIATFGYVPYAATFASYASLLGAEQLRTDLAYPGLPVRVLAHHAGISLGFYGTSHHATEDLGLLRAMAGMTVVCPCDAASIEWALRATVDLPGPVYLRLGRGREPDVYADTHGLALGRLSVLRDGGDLVIVANGVTVAPALAAAATLAEEHGVHAAVVDAHTIRPFDADGLCELAARTRRLLVAEEHNVVGGVASACADALVDGEVAGVRMRRLGMPADEYALIGPPTALYRHYGMDEQGIVARAVALVEER